MEVLQEFQKCRKLSLPLFHAKTAQIWYSPLFPFNRRTLEYFRLKGDKLWPFLGLQHPIQHSIVNSPVGRLNVDN